MAKHYKVMHIMATTGGVMGGLEKHTMELVSALAEKHDVYLLADQSYALHCPERVYFYPINFRLSRFNPYLYWQIARIIHNETPNIVHCQAGKPTSIARYLRCFFSQIQFVATIHGVHRKITPYLMMDGVIAVSDLLAKQFPATAHVRTIYNGIVATKPLTTNACQDLRQQYDVLPDENLLIAIGRLDKVKGFDLLLAALVGLDAKLWLVGDGSERQVLQEQAQTQGISDKVNFLGWRSDVNHCLQAANLCVVSSRSEGFSYVIAEALQVGCPIISTKVGIAPELLPPKWLVDNGNVQALHNTIQLALSHMLLLRAEYSPVFLRAQQQLTVSAMVQKTESFYEDLLKSK